MYKAYTLVKLGKLRNLPPNEHKRRKNKKKAWESTWLHKKQAIINVCTFKVVDYDGMKPAAAAAINPAGKPAGVNRLLAGDVRGDFSHHVRWGAARHPGASPGPRRLSRRRSTPIFPLFVSLGGERRQELVAALLESSRGLALSPQALR